MTVLADASAFVAMLTHEEDAERLVGVLQSHEDRLYCAVGAWEAVRAVARKRGVALNTARQAFEILSERMGFRAVVIGDTEWRLAVEAHRLYGKGTGHPARLNMGDCFAYACAKTNGARLLYKGDDFSHTDLA
ncbi:type II toxin-antitoxin system VapC family toxin [soil metagenome]